MAGPVGVGIIGAGNISTTYIENLKSFPDTELLAIGDLFAEVAGKQAAEHGIPASGDVSTVLEHPGVDIVVNLTVPAAHAEVAGQVIAAGKHVWNEKPLSLDLASAGDLLEAAETAGVQVGCAPDTFLGSSLQECFRLLQDGAIGQPLTGLLLMQQPGPDRWHPNPAFLFGVGAGPVFDLGPYYLTAMVQIFGPVTSVAAIDSKAKQTRTILSGPRTGEEFDVTVPSQSAALVKFASGQSITMLLSFDSAVTRTQLEVTGLDGTMLLPDPNMFEGEIFIRRMGADDWEAVAKTSAQSSRGTGVLEMARAIAEGRPHRAQGALAYHVLEIMTAIAESGRRGEFVPVESTVEPAPLLPADWDPKAATL